MDCSLQGSSVHEEWVTKSTGMGYHFLLWGNLPDPGIAPGSTTLQADALPSEPPGKPIDF